MADSQVNILIGARDAASGALAAVGRKIRGFASSVFSLRGMIFAGLGGYGLSSIMRSSLAAWGEQEQAVAKLSGVLRATGQAAGFTSQQLQEQAAALQKTTTFGDEAIINAQALLATFKAVKGDTFTRATEAILDLSAVMGQDLKASALMVGKALQDPERGITALRRAGVSFDEQQQKTIKNLAETGRLAEAQVMILRELNGQVGGVANAMSKTATGAMQQFKNAAGDVSEELGKALAPAIVLVANVTTAAMPAISEAFQWVGNNIATACAHIQTALSGWWRFMDVLVLGTRAAVSQIIKDFEALRKTMVESFATGLAKYFVTWKEILGVISTDEAMKAFATIDQSLREFRSDKLTAAELENLRQFELALADAGRQFALTLPANLERFKFDLNLPVLKMDPNAEDVLREHTKAIRNEPLTTRFLTRVPGSSMNVSNEWSKNERKLADIKIEARKHNTLLERLITITRDTRGSLPVYGGA